MDWTPFLNAAEDIGRETGRMLKEGMRSEVTIAHKGAVDLVTNYESAALDLCYVACGRFDGFWELKLNPWDVAAASLILTEAGGRISGFRGEAFSIHMKETLGSNGVIHGQMMSVLRAGSGDEVVVSKERGE